MNSHLASSVIRDWGCPKSTGLVILRPAFQGRRIQNWAQDWILRSPDKSGSLRMTERFLFDQPQIDRRVAQHRDDSPHQLFRRADAHDVAGMRIIKRAFDLVVSSLLLVLLAPVFALVAIAIKLETRGLPAQRVESSTGRRGPVFFKQMRALSDSDEPFELYKFRTMVHKAEELKELLSHLNESDGVLFKIKNDPRLTKVGRFMRRYSIDELPQLLNVLKGDMSLVGPRPLPVKDLQRKYECELLRNRRNAKPGMTGLWQISGRSNLDFREMVMLDAYYIENQRLLFDLEILLRTIPVVMFAKGAY